MLNRFFCLEFLLYLLPVSLLIGTNFPVFAIGDRVIYLGTNEAVIGLLTLGLIVRRIRGAKWEALPGEVIRAVTAYSAVWTISIFVYVYRVGEFPTAAAIIEVVRWYEYLLVFPIVFWLVRSESQVRNLMRIAAFCMILNVIAGYYQLFTIDLGSNRIYGLFISAANRESVTEFNANIVGAAFMGGGLLFFAFAVAQQGRRRHENVVFMGLCVVAMALTLSRSAMLGFLIGILWLSFYYRDQWRLFLKIGVASLTALLATILTFSLLLTRLINTFQMNAGTVDAMAVDVRYAEWEVLIWQTLDHALFGLGHGARAAEFIVADSYYIGTFALLGTPGLIALFYLFWQILWSVNRENVVPSSYAHAFKSGYLACYLAFLVTNIFAGVLYDQRMAGLFWMLTALVLRVLNLPSLKLPHIAVNKLPLRGVLSENA